MSPILGQNTFGNGHFGDSDGQYYLTLKLRNNENPITFPKPSARTRNYAPKVNLTHFQFRSTHFNHYASDSYVKRMTFKDLFEKDYQIVSILVERFEKTSQSQKHIFRYEFRRQTLGNSLPLDHISYL